MNYGILLDVASGDVVGSYRNSRKLPPIRDAAVLRAAMLALESTHRPLGPVLLIRDDRAGKPGWGARQNDRCGPYITACVTPEAACAFAIERGRGFVEEVGSGAADDYQERYIVMPTTGWRREPNGEESFRFREPLRDDVHPTFCRVLDGAGRWRYFRGMKRIGVTHQEILDECRRLIA